MATLNKRRYPDLINELAIIQGETYYQLLLTAVGDLRSWQGRGEIRRDLLANNGELLASFSFDTTVYDDVKNLTTFKPYLPASVTKLLPVTRFQGTGNLTRSSALIYDLEIESNGVIRKLAPGFVQVIGEVSYL